MILSQSSLTPIGTKFVLVEQRVTWQAGKDRVRQATLSFSLTHVSAQSKLAANSATHDASPANSRVRAVELIGLGDGAVRTLRQGRRDATGELQNPYRRRCSRRSGICERSVLSHSTWQRSSLRKWQCILPAKRDRRNRDWHLLVGRRQDCTLMNT